jgi:MFS family permease
MSSRSATDQTRLSIQTIFWQQMVVDLHVTYDQLNQSMSVNFVGLAMGCVLFIPFAKKYGRRPVYIVSTVLMLATSFWASKLESIAELYVCNLLQGLAGATNEAIVEITVCIFHLNPVTGSRLTLHRLQIYSSCTTEAP